MKKYTATSQAINYATKHLLDRPGTWASAETGKMVTRWDDELKFECESDKGVFYTDNIMEAIEWLYTDGSTTDTNTIIAKEMLEKVKRYCIKQAKRTYDIYNKPHKLVSEAYAGENYAYKDVVIAINSVIEDLGEIDTKESVAIQAKSEVLVDLIKEQLARIDDCEELDRMSGVDYYHVASEVYEEICKRLKELLHGLYEIED
jgi:hypothetical protein